MFIVRCISQPGFKSKITSPHCWYILCLCAITLDRIWHFYPLNSMRISGNVRTKFSRSSRWDTVPMWRISSCWVSIYSARPVLVRNCGDNHLCVGISITVVSMIICFFPTHRLYSIDVSLIHWGKMINYFADGIFMCILLNENMNFLNNFHWSVFIRDQLIMKDHWFG